eukprot:SM000078S22101  [mRNA]  locus=s78:399783:401855:- [translate_table: standard]
MVRASSESRLGAVKPEARHSAGFRPTAGASSRKRSAATRTHAAVSRLWLGEEAAEEETDSAAGDSLVDNLSPIVTMDVGLTSGMLRSPSADFGQTGLLLDRPVLRRVASYGYGLDGQERQLLLLCPRRGALSEEGVSSGDDDSDDSLEKDDGAVGASKSITTCAHSSAGSPAQGRHSMALWPPTGGGCGGGWAASNLWPDQGTSSSRQPTPMASSDMLCECSDTLQRSYVAMASVPRQSTSCHGPAQGAAVTWSACFVNSAGNPSSKAGLAFQQQKEDMGADASLWPYLVTGREELERPQASTSSPTRANRQAAEVSCTSGIQDTTGSGRSGCGVFECSAGDGKLSFESQCHSSTTSFSASAAAMEQPTLRALPLGSPADQINLPTQASRRPCYLASYAQPLFSHFSVTCIVAQLHSGGLTAAHGFVDQEDGELGGIIWQALVDPPADGMLWDTTTCSGASAKGQALSPPGPPVLHPSGLPT